MAKVKTKVEFRPNLAFGRQMQERVRAGLDEALEFDVVPRAADLSPFLSGNNARSISSETRMNARGKAVGAMFTQSGYGGWLEVGTARRKKTPYLGPAAEQTAPKVREAIARHTR